MKYEEMVKAIKEDEEWEEKIKKEVEEVVPKRQKHCELDALD